MGKFLVQQRDLLILDERYLGMYSGHVALIAHVHLAWDLGGFQSCQYLLWSINSWLGFCLGLWHISEEAGFSARSCAPYCSRSRQCRGMSY